MRRFVLWGARAYDVQIKGFVWSSLNEFRTLGWVPGPLRHKRGGW